MKTLRYAGLIALVVVVQSGLVLKLVIAPVNLAKEPFRREQRAAAATALAADPSPEKRAALQDELSLVARHVNHRQFTRAGVVVAVLLVIEAVGVYRWRQHHAGTKTTS